MTQGGETVELEPEDQPAQLTYERKTYTIQDDEGRDFLVIDRQPLIENLPPQEKGVVYIVPSIVRKAVDRSDVFSVGQIVTDEDNNVKHANGFRA